MDITLRMLKAKIRGFDVEGRSIRTRISKSSGLDKNNLWNLKRQLGYYTRYYLIAYGLLKGTPYHKIERKTVTLCMDIKLIQKIIFENTSSWRHKDWPLERVKELLQVTNPLSELAQETLKPENKVNLSPKDKEYLTMTGGQ